MDFPCVITKHIFLMILVNPRCSVSCAPGEAHILNLSVSVTFKGISYSTIQPNSLVKLYSVHMGMK
jgi:hypothetical protein